MSEYYPDLWVVVECKFKNETAKKVLASWYGGFADGDSWKLSSGVTKVLENSTHYEFHNYSGSIYYCDKNSHGMSAYTASVLKSLQDRAEQSGVGYIKLTEEYDYERNDSRI